MSSEPRRLNVGDVKYLSFEGGGGKGAAYLGALAAFADEDLAAFPDLRLLKPIKGRKRPKTYVINNKKIKGIAGSSAGAITATLLACGVSLEALHDFTTNTGVLGNFYDHALVKKYMPLKNREVPQVKKGNTNSCKELPMPDDILEVPAIGIGIIMLTLQPVLREALSLLLSTEEGRNIILRGIIKALERYAGPLPPEMVKRLKEDPVSYLKNLVLDYGLFSGCYSANYFANWIGEKSGAAAKQKQSSGGFKSWRTINFKEFSEVHKLDLVLTGTNIETMKSQYFSRELTPDFKVVDALRISMSFPFAFKPVRISKSDYGSQEYVGTWIDGGVLNNNPVHAFDESEGVINKGMLGLRLGEDPKPIINNFSDYLGALVNTIMSTSERGQMRTLQEEKQTIILPTGRLSTLNFTPEEEVLESSMVDSAFAVRKYFGKSGMGKVVQDYLSKAAKERFRGLIRPPG
jgi:predicted acylesterase/phospholipase RssA